MTHNYTFSMSSTRDSPYWLARARRKAEEELNAIPPEKRSPATKILTGVENLGLPPNVVMMPPRIECTHEVCHEGCQM